jgi:hypothetical protein
MSTTADTAHGLRGSQKLLEKLSKNGSVPSTPEIMKALNLPASAKIPNWLIRGIPPAYLVLEGTVQVPVAEVAAVVDRFVHLNDSAINLKILINGIPFPDVAHVVVSNSSGG